MWQAVALYTCPFLINNGRWHSPRHHLDVIYYNSQRYCCVCVCVLCFEHTTLVCIHADYQYSSIWSSHIKCVSEQVQQNRQSSSSSRPITLTSPRTKKRKISDSLHVTTNAPLRTLRNALSTNTDGREWHGWQKCYLKMLFIMNDIYM